MIIKYQEENDWHLTVAYSLTDWPDGTEIDVNDPLITVDSLLELWHVELEAANYHSMSDVPQSLIKVLRDERVDENTIKHVLWKILDCGGWIR
jgi:hypothetical protein